MGLGCRYPLSTCWKKENLQSLQLTETPTRRIHHSIHFYALCDCLNRCYIKHLQLQITAFKLRPSQKMPKISAVTSSKVDMCIGCFFSIFTLQLFCTNEVLTYQIIGVGGVIMIFQINLLKIRFYSKQIKYSLVFQQDHLCLKAICVKTPHFRPPKVHFQL